MSYPSRKEDWNRRCRHVGRVRSHRIVVNKVTRVIEQHDHHHDAAEKIDRVDPSFYFFAVHFLA